MPRMEKNPVQKALEHCDGPADLARRIGISQQAVSRMIKLGRFPADRIPDVVKALNGKLSPGELWPELAEAERLSTSTQGNQ